LGKHAHLPAAQPAADKKEQRNERCEVPGVDDIDGPTIKEARSLWPQWCEDEPALAVVDNLESLPR
jgi:hypothetical protein